MRHLITTAASDEWGKRSLSRFPHRASSSRSIGIARGSRSGAAGAGGYASSELREAELLCQCRAMSGSSKGGGYAIVVVETADRKLKLYGECPFFAAEISLCSSSVKRSRIGNEFGICR
ncbi:hypothetical protein AVEN_165845-1 [Araneus ventricosus]|uniref:Uncharacterized protein n=1 Tax=Araneus ventricosus TaxID=182803 RepID=A0A4Y2TYE4_ARAVE|nr:hypothetical protein AVEN_53924-1 [Araneus ventricosus]GBO04374.1 hypothetical protein AVEN_89386-1 [Araneus ventricosus]GBO04377.1 hypothetical protein AVEN_91600-1 [Araneus ventricosus]GBO04378.1 hypothetical protein AVEN_165845-1 [Araneus ventricosus]